LHHETKQRIIEKFFSETSKSYDRVVRATTFGFDGLWKKEILKRIPRRATQMLDQACGTGILTLMIAGRLPDCRVIGVDVTEGYLGLAQKKAKKEGRRNTAFVLGRAEDTCFDEEFDCITSSYLAKYADIDLLVANAYRMLRKGGLLVMHDFTYPSNPAFARLWETYFTLLQTLGVWIYPEWKAVFDDLPGLLRNSRWTEELVRSLRAKGFNEIELKRLTSGTAAIISARK
jgi:demethylmenaquinone methyltransferase / 2-methoxy-6-polyprenyl-1,4-benzoquinol methylase